jgi:hypothetical protein
MVRLILVKLLCNKFNEFRINVFLVIVCKRTEGLSDLYLLAFYIKRNFIFISKQIFYGGWLYNLEYADFFTTSFFLLYFLSLLRFLVYHSFILMGPLGCGLRKENQ